MALTNFASLTSEQKTVWSRDIWEEAKELMAISKFTGGENSIIHKITELTKTEKGEKAIIHLIAELVGDGVVGDNEREGQEEEMKSYTETIEIDLISHGVRQKGKMADQKTVVDFRKYGKGHLARWLATRIDQLAFLTMSGVAYTYNTDGSTRSSSAFSTLSFASDVSAPTTNRHYRVTADASGVYTGLAAGATASVDATDTMSYKAIVDAMVKAKIHYMKPLMAGGKEYFVGLIRPEGMAQLKKDPDYQNAIVTGMPRSAQNPFFTGGVVTIDGLVLHEHRYVYNTLGAASGAKWGSGSTVDGSRMLICGSQALAFADLGLPEWSEKWFQYDSSPGINVDKMFGFVKPKFYSTYDASTEDFGVMALDHAI